MRWKLGRQSTNVEDRRGQAVRPALKLGGGAILLVAVVALLLGQDPRQVIGNLERAQVPEGAGPEKPADGGAPAANDEQAQMISAVLAFTEDAWGTVFAESGQRYQPPRLVLFTDAVQSACGFSSAAVGPFYCPADQQVYIDLGFFRELEARFGAPGDFAQAYVIAHEVGHHVQNLLGIAGQVDRAGQGLGEEGRNDLSVRQELQADCFAGVWANHTDQEHRLLEPGDVEEGLAAAAAIGDDRLQSQAQGYVVPEAWTHGSSKQRMRWLRLGLEHGRIDLCDTFSADPL